VRARTAWGPHIWQPRALEITSRGDGVRQKGNRRLEPNQKHWIAPQAWPMPVLNRNRGTAFCSLKGYSAFRRRARARKGLAALQKRADMFGRELGDMRPPRLSLQHMRRRLLGRECWR
jgi:hypothetical protein